MTAATCTSPVRHAHGLGGARAVVATMHGKERVIAPLVSRHLDLHTAVAGGIDTDAFGTFTREVPRTGSALEAARRKLAAAFDRHPEAEVAIASEGSFGPHPVLPFLAGDCEIVVLADRRGGLEIVGSHVTADTNFAHAVVVDAATTFAFAERVGFPGHGVIAMACRDGEPAPEVALEKGLRHVPALLGLVARECGAWGAAFLETDMRAHRNPRRMRAIRAATLDLVRRARRRCPACASPGWGSLCTVAGLPCAWCGGPTTAARATLFNCTACAHRAERPVSDHEADPGQCPRCNP